MHRYITLLNKAPFILFMETSDYPISSDTLLYVLNTVNLNMKDVASNVKIAPNKDLRGIIAATSKLPDPLAYNIIEALANSIGYFPEVYFPVESCFKSAKWQEHIDWQNVDNKPEPAPVNSFTITVDKFTHELSIVDDVNTVLKEKVYEGVIHLESLDTKVPFPQALLKECTMEVYDIIVQTSISRAVSDKTKSKYLSVMQTGHETFNYISLRQIEKDLKAILAAFNIIVEE